MSWMRMPFLQSSSLNHRPEPPQPCTMGLGRQAAGMLHPTPCVFFAVAENLIWSRDLGLVWLSKMFMFRNILFFFASSKWSWVDLCWMIKRFYRYLPFLSSYAFRLAALLESLRRMYSVSPQIFVIFCLNCLFATWYYFSGLSCAVSYPVCWHFTCWHVNLRFSFIFLVPLSHSLRPYKHNLVRIGNQDGHTDEAG